MDHTDYTDGTLDFVIPSSFVIRHSAFSDHPRHRVTRGPLNWHLAQMPYKNSCPFVVKR